jgi:hypothetical protein
VSRTSAGAPSFCAFVISKQKTVIPEPVVQERKIDSNIIVGQDPNGTGDKRLAPGSYRLSLNYEERSFFGQLLIGRASNTTVTFGVVK